MAAAQEKACPDCGGVEWQYAGEGELRCADCSRVVSIDGLRA
ncbi:MAG: hypothetical protein ABEH59_03315 [Halobacteriales archaeon]